MELPKISEGVPISRSESATLGVDKPSHVISKSYSGANGEGRSKKYSQHNNIITPTIRVVYAYEPKIIKTDKENFRSVVQQLTGKCIHKSEKKKGHTSPESPTEDPEDTHCNDQMHTLEKKGTNVSIDHRFDFAEGFNDKDMAIADRMNRGLLDEIPLVRNNSPFCNIDEQTDIYRSI